MILIKVLNCKFQDRPNQNTTFVIWKDEYAPLTEEEVDEAWILANFSRIKPRNVTQQKNTTVKIEARRK